MVYRRPAGSQWRTKIMTFFMVISAGTFHRFESYFSKYFTKQYLEQLVVNDSIFIPQQIKMIYEKQIAAKLLENKITQNKLPARNIKLLSLQGSELSRQNIQQLIEEREKQILKNIQIRETYNKQWILNQFYQDFS